jgi:hypothetical protein
MITLHNTCCYQHPLKTFFFEPVAQCFQTQQSPHQSQNFPTFMEYKDPLQHTQEPTMNSSLGQMNPIHIISHLHKTQFNIFIPHTPTSPVQLFHSAFLVTILCELQNFHMYVLHARPISYSFI